MCYITHRERERNAEFSAISELHMYRICLTKTLSKLDLKLPQVQTPIILHYFNNKFKSLKKATTNS
jgi:hypothetical protein